MSLSCFNSIYCRNINHFVRSTCPPLLCQVSTFSYLELDLPFAMFSHQYESKAINLYYSMSTISYTPWFSYQINVTLIECSRILKHRNLSLAEATRSAMTARLFQHPGLTSIRIQSDKVILFHVQYNTMSTTLASKLYYSMSTISYTPRIPYQFNTPLALHVVFFVSGAIIDFNIWV